MSSAIMMDKIRMQPQSLAGVLEHQCGEGHAVLTRAAEMLRSAPQVVITAMGASLFAALPLESYLCSLGIDAVAIEAGEFLHYRHQAYKKAIVVAVSRSGESIEIARLLALLKGRQPLIGVCNRASSLLSREADLAIVMGSREDDIVALQTYTGTLLTLHLLAKAVEDELSRARPEIEALLPSFSDVVNSSLDKRADWDEFLQSGSSLYLLARGPSNASAQEGALLFNEVSKSPAIAMTAASFRHGPAEVVDADFRAILFTPSGKTQGLNIALAHDLMRFGGQVRSIGPRVEDATGLHLLELPTVPEMLAPIWEVVPLQAAALRLAELRGVVPGSFRFVPPVALDEANFPKKNT
jgi:glucosamine--fructose-6-phosphate aminotransferase (isomerizing)